MSGWVRLRRDQGSVSFVDSGLGWDQKRKFRVWEGMRVKVCVRLRLGFGYLKVNSMLVWSLPGVSQ